MVIKLAFAYFPVRDAEGKHNGEFEVARLDNTSVDSVHSGCEACAAFVADRVVATTKNALAEWQAHAAQEKRREKWCEHCITDCPDRREDVEKLKRAVENGDKLLQRVHDLLGIVVRDSRADDEMCIEMSNFADEVWEHLHRDDKRGPKDESGMAK